MNKQYTCHLVIEKQHKQYPIFSKNKAHAAVNSAALFLTTNKHRLMALNRS